MAESLSKPKAHWPQEKQAAFDRLIARVANRLEQLAIHGESATLELSLHINRGNFQGGRFNPDEEFS